MKWLGISLATLAVLMGVFALFFMMVINPAVMDEIRSNPSGEEAQEAMILTFAGRTLPVNYLKEEDTVYIGVDGPWWRDFQNGGESVSMLIQGETYEGRGVVVLDDPAYVTDVFSRLRPTAPQWLPTWLKGKLVVISLAVE